MPHKALDILSRRKVEVAWVLFAIANLVAMIRWERWETIPFHFIWVSLTLLYGFRTWRPTPTALTLAFVCASTGTLILVDIQAGTQVWGELFEVPLMSAMFLAMVWHARRRQQALASVERLAAERAALLERQEQFLHDASHELRTPVTIARGHLELLRADREPGAEIAVALDELERIERIVDRLLLLAKVKQPEFLARGTIDLEAFLEDVFMRWCEVALRAWRLELEADGLLRADQEALRIAVDALLENAVKYTETQDPIVLRALPHTSGVTLEVADGGPGVPREALTRIFERFGRTDDARARADGGVGLGLAIVDAIVKAHGGHCTVHSDAGGTTFALFLPHFEPAGSAVEAGERQSVLQAGARSVSSVTADARGGPGAA